MSMNARSAEMAYNNNTITWNEYRTLIEMDSVDGGDVYKWQRKETGKVEPDKPIAE